MDEQPDNKARSWWKWIALVALLLAVAPGVTSSAAAWTVERLNTDNKTTAGTVGATANVTATTSDSCANITVGWDVAAGATTYKVEVKVDAGSWTQLVSDTGNTTSYIDTTGRTSGTIYYRVTPRANSNANWEGGSAESAGLACSSGPPVNSTISLTGTAVEGAMLTATSTWTNSPTQYSYEWFRCESGSCISVSGPTLTASATATYLVPALPAGATTPSYTYKVKIGAQNAAGWGTYVESSPTATIQRAFVQFVGSYAVKTSGTSATITVPSTGVAAGNRLAIYVFSSATTVSSIDDGRSNVYSADVTRLASGIGHYIYTSNITTGLVGGDVITITFAASTSYRVALAAEFRNVAASNALDVSGIGTGTNTAPTASTSAATTQQNELVLGAVTMGGPNTVTFTPATGWNSINSNGTLCTSACTATGTSGNSSTSNGSLYPMYTIVTSTGTQTASGTLSTTYNWTALVGGFKLP